ncbi:TetR/AcrR family transcriptional regulator [Curtobacterium sp. VKM Ac-2852]|nr:TetR/AcrR family transcriptional regulator [Curtobacterium sp. VKM Ac-2852]NQX22703.1 TetR/AcrR family transcriptional regulator [Curtobacterium sp. VKM Ac-2852]
MCPPDAGEPAIQAPWLREQLQGRRTGRAPPPPHDSDQSAPAAPSGTAEHRSSTAPGCNQPYRGAVTDPRIKPDARSRILDAAARLLREQGWDAVTTRGVATAAKLQPPAIYRLFGDKDSLLDAVAERELSRFFAAKVAAADVAGSGASDPVADLRSGWAAQIEFGLTNPQLFQLLSDPTRRRGASARRAGHEALEARVRRVASTGRLRVPEHRAVGLILTAGTGVVSTLLASLPEERDPGLADAALEGLLSQILSDEEPTGLAGAMATVVAFRATAESLIDLSAAERTLLSEWLTRVISRGARTSERL